MYDLTNKLVDCSELTDMVGGEQVFDMIKVMCGGKNNSELYGASFEEVKNSRFLSVTRKGHYFLSGSCPPGFLSIKPVNIVGEHRMNAAKDGATLLMSGKVTPRFTGNWKFYYQDGRSLTKEVNSFVPGGADGCIGYRNPNKSIDAKVEEKTNRVILPCDPAPKLPSIESKILAEKVCTSAQDIIKAGLGHISDRAVTYDKPEGERSMAATVEAFNSVTGHNLTEEQGWHFMTLLKIVRSQQGNFKVDNYEDGSAYFGLAGEAASKARGVK